MDQGDRLRIDPKGDCRAGGQGSDLGAVGVDLDRDLVVVGQAHPQVADRADQLAMGDGSGQVDFARRVQGRDAEGLGRDGGKGLGAGADPMPACEDPSGLPASTAFEPMKSATKGVAGLR